MTPDYLERLNTEQREAVETLDGPLLVLAGAGTGKTRVLTTRFAHLLMTGRAQPHQVLSVTFTNKAAREMRERVGAIIQRPVDGLWLGTFHALAARMLRRNPEFVGLKSDFTILDTDDQARLLKQVAEAGNLDTKRWPVNGLMGVIQRWKDRGLTPERVTPAEDTDFANNRALEFYANYQDRLRALNATDFGDLTLHVTEILRTQPDVLERYHRLFRYILVDEYQDTNLVQYLWLRLLAQGHRNICCVGDDDQSIYSWRGAEIENILRFEKDFPGAKIVRLESNYRSTQHILAAASGLIAHNEGRLGKTLRTGGNAAAGELVKVLSLWDSEEEARMVGERVEGARRAGESLGEMAILVRAGFQTRAFEERLITLGLPYRVVGGAKFYERAEIRDAMAYFRATVQPADDLAFERIVNQPKRGLGDTAMREMQALARACGIPLLLAADALCQQAALRPKPRAALRELLEGFTRWRAGLDREGHVVVAANILEESGYIEMWKQDRSPEAAGRLENLKELLRAMADYPSMGGFLEHVALVMDNDSDAEGERICLMTLHAAKGLEFDRVFLPGWEEGLFPHQRALDESGTRGLEEERRLAYVGITRARRHCIISHAANRRIYGNWSSAIPSRFLDELPAEHIERQGSQAAARTPAFSGQFPLTTRPARVIEAAAWEVPTRPARAGAMQPGQRVFHQKFGYGRITGVEDDKLDVEFEKAGHKRVLDRFVESA